LSKAVDQGTRFETHIVTRANTLGRKARRTAKAGQKDEPDVVIEGIDMRPVLFWKNMVVTGGRRKSVSMVVLREQDYWDLLATSKLGFVVQAKATQKLSVRATLLGLVEWMRTHEDHH